MCLFGSPVDAHAPVFQRACLQVLFRMLTVSLVNDGGPKSLMSAGAHGVALRRCVAAISQESVPGLISILRQVRGPP